MKIGKVLLFLLPLIMTSLGFCVDEVTPPYNFGGGLNIKTIPSEIEDNESPDMSNFINDQYGAAFKRQGSERYITQAISSNPITSLYRAYFTSSTLFGTFSSSVRKILIATTKDSIFYSTGDVNPVWINVSSSLGSHNQHFSFAQMSNLVIMTGDKQTDNVKKFDLNSTSFTNLLSNDLSSNTINIRPKYLLNSKNYLLTANVALVDQSTIAGQSLTIGTTYYPSRIYYSILLQPSSMTASRFIDVRADDGDEITAIASMNKLVNIFKKNSIFELDFSALNLSGLGGDQVLRNIVTGFGCIAPRTLASDGLYYYFLSKDGIRKWDGGGKSRLTVADESSIISEKIQPTIYRIIRAGTYANSVGWYYPKKNWYLFAYEDPDKFPKGKDNSLLVSDIINKQWFSFNNWNCESLVSLDGADDNGLLLYGDSMDGYVHKCDLPTLIDDSRKEISLDVMDSTIPWLRGTQDIVNVKEGTASIKLPTLTSTVLLSSITKMAVINAGDWYDKTKILKSDKFYFNAYISSISNLINLRIDLAIDNVSSEPAFDSAFTSVTISSNFFTGGNNSWSKVEISLSSFPSASTWVSLSSEDFVFADTLNYYGIRFVASATAGCNVSVDDLRIVQATKNPLLAYRYTKQFSLNNPANKNWRQLILTKQSDQDSKFSFDILSNFGQTVNKIDISGNFDHSIYVGDFEGGSNVTRLNSIDFTVIDSTVAGSRVAFSVRPIAVDEKYVYAGDQYNNRIFKLDKSSLSATVFVSTVGELGSGTTNFNTIYELCVDDKFLYICDFSNQRVKVHKKNNFDYVNSFGTLGKNTTSFHNPSGCAVDEKYLYVGNDGNYNILKLDKSSGGFISSVDLNMNTIGDLTIAVDEQYLYDEFNIVNENDVLYLNVLLEKRNKSDLSLVNKIVLKPKDNTILISTFTRMGDISLGNQYLYVSFTDDINGNGSYYIQKRLKSDFSIVGEYKSSNRMFTPAVNTLSYIPKTASIFRNLNSDSSYIQLKYYDSDLDNNFKLFNQSFIYEPKPIAEKY